MENKNHTILNILSAYPWFKTPLFQGELQYSPFLGILLTLSKSLKLRALHGFVCEIILNDIKFLIVVIRLKPWLRMVGFESGALWFVFKYVCICLYRVILCDSMALWVLLYRLFFLGFNLKFKSCLKVLRCLKGMLLNSVLHFVEVAKNGISK